MYEIYTLLVASIVLESLEAAGRVSINIYDHKARYVSTDEEPEHDLFADTVLEHKKRLQSYCPSPTYVTPVSHHAYRRACNAMEAIRQQSIETLIDLHDRLRLDAHRMYSKGNPKSEYDSPASGWFPPQYRVERVKMLRAVSDEQIQGILKDLENCVHSQVLKPLKWVLNTARIQHEPEFNTLDESSRQKVNTLLNTIKEQQAAMIQSVPGNPAGSPVMSVLTKESATEQFKGARSRHSVGFQYKPLRMQTQTPVRLLVLEAGNWGSELECKMLLASLSDKPMYAALSYTWQEQLFGSEVKVDDDNPSRREDTEPGKLSLLNLSRYIQIDGRPFPVQDNLWWALSYLRSPTEQKTLWIDAVCVDQTNIEERNYQVGQMGQIYKAAEQVIVWLGRGDARTQSFFNFLLEDDFRKHFPIKKLDTTSVFGQRAERYREVYYEICNRTYWKRLWVVQEIGLAPKLQIRCGADAARWEAFTKAGLIFQDLESLPMKLSQQRVNRRGGMCTLDALLEDCGGNLCEDARDKIYGLLGLATDELRFEVDYSRSLIDLYTLVIDQYLWTKTDDILTVRFSQKLLHMWPELYEYSEQIQVCRQLLPPVYLEGVLRGSVTLLSAKLDGPASDGVSTSWRRGLSQEFGEYNAVSSYNSMIETLSQTPQDDLDRISVSEAATSNSHTLDFKALYAPRMFLEDQGQVGLAPAGTIFGDVLCQFRGCDSAAILRRQSGSEEIYNVLGRAVVAKGVNEVRDIVSRDSKSFESCRYSIPEELREGRERHTVSLEVTLKELYLLTR